MFSLQKFFGKSDVFYDLLEKCAEDASLGIQSLKTLFAQSPSEQKIDDITLIRRRDKKITEQIDEALCRTFVTELDREDIEALRNVLYKIPKTVEKIAEHYIIYSGKLQNTDFTQQLNLMGDASQTVALMVKELRKKMDLERMKGLNAKLELIEGEADRCFFELFKDLYSGKHEPLNVMMRRDLYDLMGKVMNCCRDAGHVLSLIVVKYS